MTEWWATFVYRLKTSDEFVGAMAGIAPAIFLWVLVVVVGFACLVASSLFGVDLMAAATYVWIMHGWTTFTIVWWGILALLVWRYRRGR